MKVFPEEAVREAKSRQFLENDFIEVHRQDGTISPFVLRIMETKNRLCHYPAIAIHSVAAHINHLRHHKE